MPEKLGGKPTADMTEWPEARELRLKGDGGRKLKSAGYSALELHAAGYKTDELTRLFPLKELKECEGYSVRTAMLTGASARDVLRAKFGADAWQAANFDTDMFRRSGLNVGFCVEIGLSGKEIRETGFSVSDWRDAGLALHRRQRARPGGFELPPTDPSVELRAGFERSQSATTLPPPSLTPCPPSLAHLCSPARPWVPQVGRAMT